MQQTISGTGNVSAIDADDVTPIAADLETFREGEPPCEPSASAGSDGLRRAQSCRASPSHPERSPSGQAKCNGAGNHATIDDDDDRLIELLERWDDLYHQNEIATPESLGVEDPLLRAVLLERIEERKRLYAFLRIPILARNHRPAGSGPAPKADAVVAGSGGKDCAAANQWIGRYLVVEMLDEGRQGQVFRVLHPTLRKEFILKLATRPVEIDDAWRERLLAEGRLLAACDHPNLVRVVDLDFHEGQPFVVMDHVRGVNLERYVKDRRPGLRASARIVAELARAVSFISARGIVHQDIKPRNVLIDEQGRPRLIDFGLAQHFGTWSGEAPSVTGGTAAYMSPEQALGNYKGIGPRTDVFGLGGVLFFLLTRQPVYKSESEFAVLLRAMRGEQSAPRGVDLRISRSLERICRKALDPDPDRRYQTAADLERALRRYLGRRKVLAVAAIVIFSLVVLGGFALPSHKPLARAWEGEPPGEPRIKPGIDSASLPLVVGRIDNPPYGRSAPGVGFSVPSTAPLRIASFEVKHFRGDRPPIALGMIGKSSEPILFDDDVRVHARFSTSAYCYLLALNPDGKVQLCYPVESTEAPHRLDDLDYPSGSLYFPLNDGAGLQAFVLLASRRPLPPFSRWKGGESMRWGTVRADDVGLWSFNGSAIEPLADGRRGPPRSHDAAPRPFQELCDWAQQLDDIDAAQIIAFPVAARGLTRSSR